MPKVSVIVPNYNHAPYLQERLRSIIFQTYQDFEIIILDDCSTDDSRSIIEQYRETEKVTHIVYNTINSGSTFRQWEKGVQLAKGEYIWLAESDDWCEPTLLETLVSGIESTADCAISYCQSYCVKDYNEILWQTSHPFLSEILEGKEFIIKKLVRNNSIVNASMALWRRELFFKVSPEFYQFKFSGDWLFWLQLSMYGKVHISGKVLNYFRKHKDDVTTRTNKNGLNFVEDIRVINWISKKNLISNKIFFKVLKHKYRRYQSNKKDITVMARNQIEALIKEIGLSKKQQLILAADNLVQRFKKKNSV